MVPLDTLPDSGPGTPITQIWINYPLDEKDELVEAYLKQHITADWPNQHEIVPKIVCYPGPYLGHG